MSFNVSDKVVCLRTAGPEPEDYLYLGEPVVKGVVYVVSRVIHYPHFPDGVVGLQLVGSSSWGKLMKAELGWHSSAFRLLSEIQAENRLKAEQEAAK